MSEYVVRTIVCSKCNARRHRTSFRDDSGVCVHCQGKHVRPYPVRRKYDYSRYGGLVYFFDAAGEVTQKRCSGCGQILPIEQYHVQRRDENGKVIKWNSKCKTCWNLEMRGRAKPAKQRNYGRMYSWVTDEQLAAWSKEYHELNGLPYNEFREVYLTSTGHALVIGDEVAGRFVDGKMVLFKFCGHGHEHSKKTMAGSRPDRIGRDLLKEVHDACYEYLKDHGVAGPEAKRNYHKSFINYCCQS